MAENFNLIFGQSASQQYAWSDSDYQNGWGTVGSTPPTAEQFDALQNRSDKKSQELNNRLTPLESNAEASFRQPLTTYAVGDMRYCDGLPPLWFLYCSVDGTTDSGAITLPDPLVENAVITDGTVTWKARKISSADGMPIGAMLPFAGNGNIPSGYLLCDGSAVSRTMFPDLFAAIGTTYGAGDGSTTFNVPDYNAAERFAQGSTTAGTVKQAGLPNITGRLNDYAGGMSGAASGSFYQTRKDILNFVNTAGPNISFQDTNFDASRSSSIYGNSTTVQPPALTTRYIIKAFDGQTPDSALIDITQYANELAGKADRSLSNLTDAGKSFSFPSGTWIDISSYSSTQYVVPADGFVMGVMGSDNTNGYMSIGVVGGISSSTYSQGSAGLPCFIPVKKGDSVYINTYQKSIYSYRFYYASGEVPA